MGIKIPDTFERKGTGEFPLIEDIDTEGGCQVCSTSLSEVKYRKAGMVASVASTGQVWKLTVLPDTWSEMFAGDFIAGGDLSGSPTLQTVIAIQGNEVSDAAPSDGDGLFWNSDTSQWEPSEPPAGFTAGGDLEGTSTSQTVVAIQGNAVSDASPTNDYVLTWNSSLSQWEPKESGGGGGGGYTESVYIADPRQWVDTGSTLPGRRRYLNTLIVGDTIYLIGGPDENNVAKNNIWSAPTSDPTNVTNTGYTYPVGIWGTAFIRIGSYLYSFGPDIYQAAVATPTSWSDTGYGTYGSQSNAIVAIIGSSVYMFGGTISGSLTGKIITASLSDPITWSDTGDTLPSAMDSPVTVSVNKGKVYMYNGFSASEVEYKIYTANMSSPSKVFQQYYSLPEGNASASVFSINGNLYLVGGVLNTGSTTKVYIASLSSDELNFREVNTNGLPASRGYTPTSSVLINGYCYIYGGREGNSGATNTIYRSRSRISALAQAEVHPYWDQMAITSDGQFGLYSVNQKCGVNPCFDDRYAPR